MITTNRGGRRERGDDDGMRTRAERRGRRGIRRIGADEEDESKRDAEVTYGHRTRSC